MLIIKFFLLNCKVLQGSQIFIQILWLGGLACSRLVQSRGWVRNLIFGGTSSNDYFKFQRSKTFFTFLTRPEPVTSVAANTWGQYISIIWLFGAISVNLDIHCFGKDTKVVVKVGRKGSALSTTCYYCVMVPSIPCQPHWH